MGSGVVEEGSWLGRGSVVRERREGKKGEDCGGVDLDLPARSLGEKGLWCVAA